MNRYGCCRYLKILIYKNKARTIELESALKCQRDRPTVLTNKTTESDSANIDNLKQENPMQIL